MRLLRSLTRFVRGLVVRTGSLTRRSPGARGRILRTQTIPLDLTTVAEYFEEPRNLEELTPPWLGFVIEEVPEGRLVRGSRIRYRLRLFGVPMTWHTLIERSDPGWGFVDTQTSGPYRSWTHTHTFTARDGGVVMEDRVDYELPFGPLGFLAAPLVRLQLAAIFGYRRRRVARLGGVDRLGGVAPLGVGSVMAMAGHLVGLTLTLTAAVLPPYARARVGSPVTPRAGSRQSYGMMQ